MSRKIPKYAAGAVLVLLVVAQLLQPDRANPRSDPEASFEAVAKPSPKLAAIVRRACYDCHSHNTNWPWYSRIAPVSWLVADDVKEGRSHLNFSEWKSLSPDVSRVRLKDACQKVTRKDMPPWTYALFHAGARLTEDDVKTLCDAGQTP